MRRIPHAKLENQDQYINILQIYIAPHSYPAAENPDDGDANLTDRILIRTIIHHTRCHRKRNRDDELT